MAGEVKTKLSKNLLRMKVRRGRLRGPGGGAGKEGRGGEGRERPCPRWSEERAAGPGGAAAGELPAAGPEPRCGPGAGGWSRAGPGLWWPSGAVGRGVSRTNHLLFGWFYCVWFFGYPHTWPGVGHFPCLHLARQRLPCSDTRVSPASRFTIRIYLSSASVGLSLWPAAFWAVPFQLFQQEAIPELSPSVELVKHWQEVSGGYKLRGAGGFDPGKQLHDCSKSLAQERASFGHHFRIFTFRLVSLQLGCLL